MDAKTITEINFSIFTFVGCCITEQDLDENKNIKHDSLIWIKHYDSETNEP